jgi:hypothetical protein
VDYAYRPPAGNVPDTALDTFGDYYRSRGNTTLLTTLSAIGAPSLESLVRHLNHLDPADKPIGDVFIASHGNDTGWLQIRVASFLPLGNVDYETLLAHRHRLGLATDTTTPAGGGNPGSTVRFRACRIGHAEPFMQLLTAAFGAHVRVTAAKHFFMYGTVTENGQEGVFEYLAIDHRLPRPDDRRLATRAAAVAAFRAGGFHYYNGDAVENAKWGEWIPHRKGGALPAHKSTRRLRVRLAAGERAFNLNTEFRVEREVAPDAVPVTGAVPADQPARRTLARSHLATLAGYLPGDFPVYERHGFADLPAFVDAHAWQEQQVSGQSALVGHRVDYSVIVPIVGRPGEGLLHNLVPTSQTGPLTARTGLDESDTQLFWEG